jgi:hypothetical protein
LARTRPFAENMAVTPLIAACQEQAPAAGGGFLDWLAALGQRPGVVETLLALMVVGIGLAIWLRLLRVVGNVRSRAAIEDYLLGVEQALAQDLDGAHARLQKVLDRDPENHYARLLFGQVLAQRGEPAQAHKHHLYLQQAFAVESVENDLRLAQALLAVGRPQEAGDAAERALNSRPGHAATLEFLFRARLQSGDAEAAAAAGRRLLAHLPAEQHAGVRADVALAEAHAGGERLQRGDLAGAQRLLELATAAAPGAPAVRLLAARVHAAHGGLDAAAQALLAAPAETGTQLPALALPGAGPGALPVVATPAGLPALGTLLPAGRWRCGACGAPLTAAAIRCPRCHKTGSAEVAEPLLFAGVETPGHLADAIEENQAHVARAVRQALAAPAGADGDGARAAALALGGKAVHELLRQACQGSAAEAAIALLQQLGPAITPQLFAAADELEDARFLPIGGGAIAAVVGRVVQGFDRTALPHVEALFATARPATRKVLVDYFLGLADPAEFQLVLEHFPPLEILDRLNKVEGPVLRRFVQAVPPQHFVADVLLREPAFDREDELLAAIPGAQHAEVLERVLVQRGPSRTLVRALLAALGEEALGAVSLRVLRAFGDGALDHVLSAFVDRERDAAVRARLADVLAGLGPRAVERLCGSFGPEPAAIDDDLRGVLERMGDAGVPALQAAYARPSLLERLTVGLFGKSHHRRSQIVRALAAIRTPAAAQALRQLRETEGDANLKLRLQQALHRIDEGGPRARSGGPEQEGGSRGQVG